MSNETYARGYCMSCRNVICGQRNSADGWLHFPKKTGESRKSRKEQSRFINQSDFFFFSLLPKSICPSFFVTSPNSSVWVQAQGAVARGIGRGCGRGVRGRARAGVAGAARVAWREGRGWPTAPRAETGESLGVPTCAFAHIRPCR